MEQIEKIIKDLQKFLKKVDEKVGKFTRDMNDLVNLIQQIVENEIGRSKRAVMRGVDKIDKKLRKYQADAQKWVDDQLAEIQRWLNEQIQKAKDQIKRQKAKEKLSVMECATKQKLPESAVNTFIKAIPDPPIPVPPVPTTIKIELPTYTLPTNLL